ncbi:MAG: polysaccharide deacetylase family protein [Bacteroidetes bacterium]|nr:polysaccharide deacetylase family protein [Bacteroidota bacterium]
MKSLCLYFQIHQPFRLRTYRFFDIGSDHYYYDDYQNKRIVRRIASNCYLPANEIMLSLIKEYGDKFKVSFSISGTAIEQFQKYCPEVIDSFKKLAKTGNVEFLGETYSHSLASVMDAEEFKRQVKEHSDMIEKLFGKRPVTFRNTELIFSNDIAQQVYDMGFQTMLTEGAKQVLAWKSPNFLYCSAANERLKILLRNYQLSDDIAFRFSQQGWSEWPMTAEKYLGWLNAVDKKQEIVNLFMDYETFGEHQKADSGIFSFLNAFPVKVIKSGKWKFLTPAEASRDLQPVASLNVPHAISWADEERDLTAWKGNDLQDEAIGSLYSVTDLVSHCDDRELLADWHYLQASDHFYYMCTKWFSDGAVHHYFNPYSTPYEAFLNYMNVLSDFLLRLKLYAYSKGLEFKTSPPKSLKSTSKEVLPQKKSVVAKAPKTKTVAAKKLTKTVSRVGKK